MADKSVLSLFSMPLPPSISSPLLLCCLRALELCSIKLSSLSGTNCNGTRISAQSRARELAVDAAQEQEVFVFFFLLKMSFPNQQQTLSF